MFKKTKFIIEYLFVLVMEGIFCVLPRKMAIRGGEILGWISSKLLPKRDRLIMENLKKALPEKSIDEHRMIAKEVWRNLGRTAVEFIRLNEITRENFHDFVDIEGKDRIEKAALKGKGVIFVALHMTNWEVTGLGTGLLSGNLSVVARPMKNPYVDRWVQDRRRRDGTEVLLHRNAVKECLKALQKKRFLGILVDQNLYQGGVFVQFFGRPAATTHLPALLNLRTGAPILIGYSLRAGDKIRNIYIGPFNAPDIQDPKERLQVHTQLINDEIEKLVKAHPGSWFWLHNRWKRQPDASEVSL